MTALPASETKPRLLIADDDPAIVKFLISRCENLGFAVDTASNGLQLLLKARQGQPDVVIVDINMPELDGISASVRLLDPGNKSVNVIVVTGSSNPESMERCRSLGMYYGQKGPNFWKSIENALVDIYPNLAPSVAQDRDRRANKPSDVPARPRVLVIDDDPAVGTFLASRLDKYGVDTLYAADAQQAARIAARHQPSVIISDYDMPEGDAEHVLRLLRNNPSTATIPVIVLSGKNIDPLTERRLTREIFGKAGAERIVKKSYDIQELFGALEKFCAFNKGTGA